MVSLIGDLIERSDRLVKRDSSASAKCGMVLRVTGDEAVTWELILRLRSV